MSYRSAWFSREQIHNIARTFSSIYDAKHGIGQDNDCNLALYLLDRGSRNRALAGGYGCNIEEKLINLGADRMRVRETLEMVNLYPDDFDTVSGY